MQVKIRDLKLADVVGLGEYPFSDAVVKQIKDGCVTVFRPYAITADFSYTGGVIPYIGIEEIIYYQSDDRGVELLASKDLK